MAASPYLQSLGEDPDAVVAAVIKATFLKNICSAKQSLVDTHKACWAKAPSALQNTYQERC